MQRETETGYTPGRLAERTGGRLLQRASGEFRIRHLLTDSRKLVHPEDSVFFALGSGARNGHLFVEELYHRGVRCFVMDREPRLAGIPEAFVILVEDTLRALQDLAASHRADFNYPVVGITGSNGKTVVKEWIHHLLSPDVRIVRSPKSHNSQIGVPLSVWLMGPDDRLALFEAGISLPGEMDRLERIIRPEIGIFTNLLDAHDEGFPGRAAKAREKYRLFRRARYLIHCADHEAVRRAVEEARGADAGPHPHCLTWGASPDAGLRILSKEVLGDTTRVEALYEGRRMDVTIPFTDPASLENAMHAWMLMLHLSIPEALIRERMLTLPMLSMRMELRDGINGCVLVDDSYSADLSSLRLALDFLARQRRAAGLTVVLSDILQSGRPPDELYREVAVELSRRGVGRLIGIGPAIAAQAACFEGSVPVIGMHASTDLFLEQFHPTQFRDEAILLKGARSFGFERIAARLEARAHQTVLEIDLAAIAHNLAAHRRMLAPGVRIMAMVKAFSYGAGAYEVASLLQFHGADWLAVAYADEGAELRRAGIRTPIVVMNPEPAAFRTLTDHDLQPEIHSFEGAVTFARYLASEGLQGYPVHVKIDTGMHRLGFLPGEADALCRMLMESGCMHVVSVFSHLAAAEDPGHDAFTRLQAGRFAEVCERIRDALGYGFLRHLCNTAGIRRHGDLQFEMVRLGIGLYGVDPSGTEAVGLRHALSLSTTVAQVRSMPVGETVGYGRRAMLQRDSRIATLRIGYADGFPRCLGNGTGSVLIDGIDCPVVGNVCMDMTMVDVTDCGDVVPGARALVFGPQRPVTELARRAGTIPYELLTGISARVRRLYVEE
jgi:alanine racemase